MAAEQVGEAVAGENEQGEVAEADGLHHQRQQQEGEGGVWIGGIDKLNEKRQQKQDGFWVGEAEQQGAFEGVHGGRGGRQTGCQNGRRGKPFAQCAAQEAEADVGQIQAASELHGVKESGIELERGAGAEHGEQDQH